MASARVGAIFYVFHSDHCSSGSRDEILFPEKVGLGVNSFLPGAALPEVLR